MDEEALAWKADEAAEKRFAVELAPSKLFAFGNDTWSYGVARPPNAVFENDAWLYGGVASPYASPALSATFSKFVAS